MIGLISFSLAKIYIWLAVQVRSCYHRCAAHTLNLVASQDSNEAMKNWAYKTVCRRTNGKCQALWNKQVSMYYRLSVHVL